MFDDDGKEAAQVRTVLINDGDVLKLLPTFGCSRPKAPWYRGQVTL